MTPPEPSFACPSCRKPFTALAEPSAVCSRCGCDFTELLKIARGASRRLSAARAAFARSDYSAALRLAGISWQLRRTPHAAQLASAAAAALGDVSTLREWKHRTAATAEP